VEATVARPRSSLPQLPSALPFHALHRRAPRHDAAPGRTSDAIERGGTTRAARTEADLLPGLADESFRRGVRNHVGTAWEIDDGGAVEFARVFHDALWAACQHHGDPQHTPVMPGTGGAGADTA
jgi:hypothetical protein